MYTDVFGICWCHLQEIRQAQATEGLEVGGRSECPDLGGLGGLSSTTSDAAQLQSAGQLVIGDRLVMKVELLGV